MKMKKNKEKRKTLWLFYKINVIISTLEAKKERSLEVE